MTIYGENIFLTENWTDEELTIFKQFKFTCINCNKRAIVLHELIPKSKLRDWKRPGNRVPLCFDCHLWAHKRGTRHSRKILAEQRDIRLNLYATN